MAAYVDIGAFKASVDIDDTVDDANIQRALDAGRDWIDNYCGRTFAPLGDSNPRIYDPTSYDRLSIDDAVGITEVAQDRNFDGSFASVLAPSSYQLYPLDVGLAGSTTQGGYTEIRLRPSYAWLWGAYWWEWQPDQLFLPGRQVRVTPTAWGFVGQPQPPAAVELANILLANRYFRRPGAPFGLWESPQFGTLERLPANDPDVISLLSPYRAPNATWVVV